MSNKQLQAYKKDVWLFRLGGVALYQSVIDLTAVLLLSLVPLFGQHHRSRILILLCTLTLVLLQLLPSAILSYSQGATEPQPAPLEERLPRSAPVQLAALLKPAGRVLGRARRLRDLQRALALAGGYSLCGAAFVSLYIWMRGGQPTAGSAAYGMILGVSFVLFLLSRGGDVLTFPSLQRHRIFRLKQQLLPALGPSVRVAAAAFAACIVFGLLGLLSLRGIWNAQPFQLLVGGVLCCFCFWIGHSVVQTVFTERLSFTPGSAFQDGSDANSVLFSALQDNKEEALHASALYELCHIAETQGRDRERRLAVFADETGAAWQLPSRACLREVESLTAAIAEALPQSAPRASTSGTFQPPKWNQRPTTTKPVVVTPDRQQAAAAWQLRARYQKTAWAVRTLAGFAAASLDEDRLGVLQLTEPTLGAVAQAILSLLLALQAHQRTIASTRRRDRQLSTGPDETEQFALALADVATTAACTLGDTFGSDLVPLLLSAPGKAAFGSQSELAAALEACMRT